MLSSLNTLAGSSILFPKKTPISPPANLTITDITETTISIQYDYVSAADNYVITTSPPTTTWTTTSTSYTLTGLTSGVLYTIYVRSQSTIKNSTSSPVSISDTTGVKTVVNVNATASLVAGSNTVFLFNGTSGFYRFGNIISSNGISMRVLAVAGGGGGGAGYDGGGGGGGGGGVVDSSFLLQGNNWLEINSGAGGIGGNYGIVDTMGSGGFVGGNTAVNFGGGVLGNVLALGGGAGGEYSLAGSSGGSGGGAGYGNIVVATGNTTLNNNASSGGKYVSGGGSAGGGGAGAAGTDASGGLGGGGGAGYQSSITGSSLYWGGGGGGVSIAGNGVTDSASLFGPNFTASSTNTSILLNGTNQYLDGGVNYQSAPYTTAGTVEMWIKNVGNVAGYQPLIGVRGLYAMYLYNNILIVYDWNAAANKASTTTINDGQWHHVALVFQLGVTNGSKLYYDASAVYTFTYNFNSGPYDNFLIGRGGNLSGQHFSGYVDDARVWNTVRTDAEILANYNRQISPTTPGLTGYWLMNEGTGTTVANQVSGGPSLTLVNSPTWTAGRIINTLYSSSVYAPSVNKIYSFPASTVTGNVLILDVSSSTYTSISNTSAYKSAVYAPNGKIYALLTTTDTSTNILIVNTLSGDNITTITGINNGSSATAWENGVLAPNGNIYFIPRISTSVLIVNTVLDTASTSVITGLAGANNWMGGVLGQNGKIYCAPLDSSFVMTIDTTTNTANQTAIAVQSGTDKWNYGVAGPNGKIYFFPRTTGRILAINTYNDTIDSSFAFANYGAISGALAPNGKIYCSPETENAIVVINPMTNGVSTFGSVSTGNNKYYSTVAADNGILYGVPYSANQFLQMTPTLPTIAGGAAGGLGGGGGGAVVNYFGTVIAGGSGGGSAYSTANPGGNSAVVPIVGGGHGAVGTGGGGGGGTFKDAIATLNRTVFVPNGTVVGTATFTNDCPVYTSASLASVPLANYVQKSFYFNGSTYVALGNASNYAFDTGTYECLFKVPVNGSGIRALMAKSGVYGLYLDASNRLVAGYYNSGSRVLQVTDASFVNDNVWHHAALTFNRGNAMTLYLDGIQKGSSTSYSYVPIQTTSPIQIGADNSANLFTGSIANVRVWNAVCSAADISANRFRILRNCDVAADGLHGSYPLNDASSVIANYAPRIGGYGGSGAVAVSVPTVNIFKKNNYGLVFRGSTGAIQCAAVSTEFALNSGTIGCWIKTASAGSGLRALVVKPNAYGVYLNNGVLGAYDFSTSTFITSSVNVANNQWHHILFIFNDRVVNGSTLYVDGTLKATFTYTILNQTGILGLRNNPSDTTQGFLGQIYNVRIWNYAKTDFVGISSLSLSPEMGLVSSWPLNEGVNTSVYNYAAGLSPNPATMPGTADFSWNAISPADYAPTQLSVVNISETTATLNFQMNGYAVSYDITTTPSTSTWNITNNTFQFTGLIAGTNYTVNVYGIDKYGQRSAVAASTFKTFSNTNYYYKFDVGDFSNNLGILNYKSGTAGASVYDASLVYSVPGKFLYVKAITIFNSSTYSFTVTGYQNAFQNGVYDMSGSTGRVGTLGYNAFSTVASNFWESDLSRYNASGVYIGTVTTSIQSGGSISGEWLQIKLPYQLIVTSYRFRSVLTGGTNNTHTTAEHYLVGSNDGVTWNSLDYYNGGTSAYVLQDIGMGSYFYFTKGITNSTSYNYYRIVANRTNGYANVALAQIDLFGSYVVYPSTTLLNSVLFPVETLSPVQGINSNSYTATSYVPPVLYQNGVYDVSASSSSLGAANVYYAFDSSLSTWWSTDYYGSNGYSVGYTQNPYDACGNYVGGGTGKFYRTITQNAGTLSGEYIQIKTPYSSKLTQFRAQRLTLYTQPKTISVLGSNDQSTWNLLATQTIALPDAQLSATSFGPTTTIESAFNAAAIAVSADNNRMFIARYGAQNQSGVYNRSTNTWTFTPVGTTLNWYCCAMTPDGRRAIVGGNLTRIYHYTWDDATGRYANETVSQDTTTTRLYSDLAVSADGTRLVACAESSRILFATWDSGNTRYGVFNLTLDTTVLNTGFGSRGGVGMTFDGSTIAYGTTGANGTRIAVWNGTNYSDAVATTSSYGGTRYRFLPDNKTIIMMIQTGFPTFNVCTTAYFTWNGTSLSASATSISSLPTDSQSMWISGDGRIIYTCGATTKSIPINYLNAVPTTIAVSTNQYYNTYRFVTTQTFPYQIPYVTSLDISGVIYDPIRSDIYQVGNGALNLSTKNAPYYLTLPSFTTTLTGFSTAFWVRGDIDASNARIFDFGQPDASNVLSARFVGGVPRLFMNQLGNTYTYNLGSISLVDNSWNHIAWSIAPSTGVWTAYLNGVALSTGVAAYPTLVSRTANYIGKYISDTSIYVPTTDGWTAQATDVTLRLDWVQVAWSPKLSLFATITYSGTTQKVMTSSNGVNWTLRNTPNNNGWHTICWSPEREIFVALSVNNSENDRVMTSFNGIDWSIINPRSTVADSGRWIGICWSDTLAIFCAVGESGAIMTSPDGTTWTSRSSGVSIQLREVIWIKELGIFVVAGANSGRQVLISSNGTNWVPQSTPGTSSTTLLWTKMEWVPTLNLIVAVAFSDNTSNTNRIMTSSNGTSWALQNATTTQDLWGVKWSQELQVFKVVGGNGIVLTSTNGTNWATETGAGTTVWRGLAYSSQLNMFCAVGNSTTNAAMIYSTRYKTISPIYVDDFRTFNSAIDSTQVANLYYGKTFVQGLQPINLTILNITVNPSITLSFTANPNVTVYEILTSPPTQKWTTTNTTITLTGLSNSTTYILYVYGLNDLGDRSPPASITVKMFDTPEYYYKFDTGDFSGGYIANYKPTAVFDTSYSSTDLITSPITTSNPAVGTGALYLNRATKSNLILPNFTNSANGMSLSSWFKSSADASNSVIFDSSGASTLLSVRLYNGRPTFFLLESSTEYSGAIEKTFVDGSWNHLLWNIDSIGYWSAYVNGLEYNMSIRTVTATLIDSTSATITYTAFSGATSYQIRTVPQTSMWTTTGLSQVITGLNPNTNYRVLVSALLGTTKKSQSAEVAISTYGAVSTISVIDVSGTSANITYSPIVGVNNYVVKYTNSSATLATVDVSGTSYLASNFGAVPNSVTVDPSGAAGIGTYSRNTSVRVAVPATLTVVSNTTASVDISFSSVVDVSYYNVDTIPSVGVRNIYTSPFTITGLTPSSIYTGVQIRSVQPTSMGTHYSAWRITNTTIDTTPPAYLQSVKISYAGSMRTFVYGYTGPVVRVRRSTDNVESDFYSDATQSYLTMGLGGSGTSYATWIGAATGYITIWYNQNGSSNHARNTANNTTQPNLVLRNGKYIVQWQVANSTYLVLDTAINSNTVFSQFWNNNSSYGTIACQVNSSGTIINFGMRFGAGALTINGDVANPDWFIMSGIPKISYVNGQSTMSLTSLSSWKSVSVSVTNPGIDSGSVGFKYIGRDGYSISRSINGYMTEFILHNTVMDAGTMTHFYNNRLVTSAS